MKTAFSTLGCPDWDFDRILSFAKAQGYDGIELRGIGQSLATDTVPELQPENIALTAEKLKKSGLSLCCIDCSATFDTAEKTEKALREGAFAIEAAQRLGAPYLRVFGDSIPSPEEEKTVLDRVAEGVQRLCRQAEHTDVKILLEVHGDFNTVDRLLSLEKKIAHPQFGVLWDVEHTGSDDIFGFYKAIRHLVHHVHLKDFKINAAGEKTLCPIGEGDLPLQKILSALQQEGYRGFCSLEWEKRWHAELAAPEEVFPAFRKWIGEAFQN